MTLSYREFLERKVCAAPSMGVGFEPSALSARLLPHQHPMVHWLIEGGRRALFASFGLGKTVVQLEAVRICSEHEHGRGLIVLPLGVRQEFRKDASEILHWNEPPRFIRSIDEADATGVYLTNYETIRDGHIDPRHFVAASLDEASVLRGFGGTKTFREFMRLFAGDGKTLNERVRDSEVKYRFVATATPSPNEFIELLAYAAYLGIMEVSQAKTRWFKRDSEKADQLTLHPHKEAEFWAWVSTWALFVTKPSDLGSQYSDEGYELPALDVRWHEIPSDHAGAGANRDGQGQLFRNSAIGVTSAAKEKRDSLSARIAKMLELRSEDPDAHRVIWHDLEAERILELEREKESQRLAYLQLQLERDALVDRLAEPPDAVRAAAQALVDEYDKEEGWARDATVQALRHALTKAEPPSDALRDAKRLKDYFDNANCITHPSLYYSSAEPFTAWCRDIDEFIGERADVAAATKEPTP